MKNLTLELGKRYRTRDGRETEPLEERFDPVYSFEAEVDGFPFSWTEDGRYFKFATSNHRLDLVEEIEEEVQTKRS